MYCDRMRGRGSRSTCALVIMGSGCSPLLLAAAGELFCCSGAETGRERPTRPHWRCRAWDCAARQALDSHNRCRPARPPRSGGFSPSRTPVRWRGRAGNRRGCRTICCSAPFWRTATCAAGPAAAPSLPPGSPGSAIRRRRRPSAACWSAWHRPRPGSGGRLPPSPRAASRAAGRPATAVRAEPRCRRRSPPPGRAPADAEAQFVGGLAALRLGQGHAAALFEAAYRTAETTALRAAGAFWAARVAQRGGDRGKFAVWMRRAALEDDTFYGLIARRALGPAVACVPSETLGNADIEALLATPQGRRAFALLQVGEKRLAEAELRALWVDTAQDGVFDRSIVLAARAVGFTQLGRRDRAERDARARMARRWYGCGRPAASWSIRRWSMPWSAMN